MLSINVEDLEHEGLVDLLSEPHLTQKGRAWLHALEEVETDEIVDLGETASDLIVATSGLVR